MRLSAFSDWYGGTMAHDDDSTAEDGMKTWLHECTRKQRALVMNCNLKTMLDGLD
jgi:hypothetical protein